MINIKNIILDLGGVLINLDYNKTNEALSKLGYANGFTKAKQINLFDKLEEGKVSELDFLKEFNTLAGANHEHKTIIDAWNAILLDFPYERLALLKELNENYRVFLFSNTNTIHIKEVNAELKKQHSIDNLNGYFEKVYLSHELGIRKPKIEGFKHIVETNNLTLKETLFIDDSPQHIEGAKKAGLEAEWLDLNKEDIHEMLTRLSLI
jgi:glucose-1-phosphatase